MKAKKTLRSKGVDCAVRIPHNVLHFYIDVAKLAGVTPNDAMNVILAATALQAKRTTQRR